MEFWIQKIGLLASITLPFFNIPLMARMIKRKSSQDLSLVWLLGVFICILLMGPAAWTSSDFIFKIFSILNLIFFTGVTVLALWFRRSKYR